MNPSDEVPIFIVYVHRDMTTTVDSPGLSGEQLLDAAAHTMAAAIQVVEETWTLAHNERSGVNAGQCVINRAGVLLRKRARVASGTIEATTKEKP